MEATDCGRRIRVEFYVALSTKACKDVDCLRQLKQQNQHVGVIRCKEDGACRHYVRVNGERNYELAKAACRVFTLGDHWLLHGTKEEN
jgi:transcription elongation factor